MPVLPARPGPTNMILLRPQGLFAARSARLLELGSSPVASTISSQPSSFSWDAFAGRYARSSEAHVCAARAAFNGFLESVRDALGESAGEREALVIYNFFASYVYEANGKAAAAAITPATMEMPRKSTNAARALKAPPDAFCEDTLIRRPDYGPMFP